MSLGANVLIIRITSKSLLLVERSFESRLHIVVECSAIDCPAILTIGDDVPPSLHGAPLLACSGDDARHLVAAAGGQRRQAHPGVLTADLT